MLLHKRHIIGAIIMSFMDKSSQYMTEEINLTGKPLWTRLLYAAGACILGYLTFICLVVLGVAQFVFVAVTKSKNPELARFSADLLIYLREILAFIGFQNDRPPFPFAPFPGSKKD